MKAVIPVAGVGSRLRPHTHTQPKPLIPVAGKPILGHIVEGLLDAGITELVFIIGYLGDKIKMYAESNFAARAQLEFVIQEPRRGLAHALWLARDTLKHETAFLMVLGDTIFGQEDLLKVLAAEGGVLGVQRVEKPQEFGVAVIDEQQMALRLIEKPQIPTSNLALTGIYKIPQVNMLLEVLEEQIRRGIAPDGEYSLADSLSAMIARGAAFRTLRIENWFDCGRKQTLLHTNRILLERLPETAHQFPRSVIIPPVHISPGCTIEDSIIGPYVAVAENAIIRRSIVQDSILGAWSQLEGIILNRSVIGNDTSLKGNSTSVNIGDNTEIDLDA